MASGRFWIITNCQQQANYRPIYTKSGVAEEYHPEKCIIKLPTGSKYKMVADKVFNDL